MTAPFTPGLFLQPFVVSQLVGSVIAEIVDGTGLSGTEFAVVSSLALWDDPTPTALARTLGMSPTTLSAILKRLEERGLVQRARDPGDRRRHVLRLSRAGRGARDLAVARFPGWLERVKAQLGGDPEEVLEPMRRLEGALRAALAASLELELLRVERRLHQLDDLVLAHRLIRILLLGLRRWPVV